MTCNKVQLIAGVSIVITILAAARESGVIGGLILDKSLGKSFALTAERTRNPYYFALAITANFVLEYNAGVALSFSNLKKFFGNIQYQNQSFNEDNAISAT